MHTAQSNKMRKEKPLIFYSSVQTEFPVPSNSPLGQLSPVPVLAKTPTYTCWWQTALDPFGSTPWANISSCPRDQAELRSHQSRGENLPLLAQHLCFIHQEGLFGGIIDFSPDALWTRWYFEISSKLVCSTIRQILISIYFSLRWEEPKHRPLHLWHWDSHTWSNGSSNKTQNKPSPTPPFKTLQQISTTG